MAEPQDLSAYVDSIAFLNDEWRKLSACRGASTEIVRMFTCTEDETFEFAGRRFTGLDAQTYLVEAYCQTCPVQWECARHAIVVEEGQRTTGAWAMTKRDRGWLARQPDGLSIIDAAKVDDVPVHVAVASARAERV